MPPPKTKASIVESLNAERRRLAQNLALLSPAEMLTPGVVGEWSMKDILAHLADWEAHMPVWVEAARRGDPVSEIEPGLTWKEFDAFNQRIYTRHRHQPLEEVVFYFQDTHRLFMEMVEAMPEDEILAHGRYAFIGKGAVVDWLGAYAAHDRWAKTHLRQWIKQKEKA